MNDMTESAGFSLADLADIDVSDIEEIRFVAIPQGVYDFEVTGADLHEDEKDGERRFKVEFELKILEAHAILEPGVDKESIVGKLHKERFYIKPNEDEQKVRESIGRVRAFITDIGQDSSGKLGEIVRNAKGHTFKASIVNRRNKDDPTNPFKSLKLETPKR